MYADGQAGFTGSAGDHPQEASTSRCTPTARRVSPALLATILRKPRPVGVRRRPGGFHRLCWRPSSGSLDQSVYADGQSDTPAVLVFGHCALGYGVNHGDSCAQGCITPDEGAPGVPALRAHQAVLLAGRARGFRAGLSTGAGGRPRPPRALAPARYSGRGSTTRRGLVERPARGGGSARSTQAGAGSTAARPGRSDRRYTRPQTRRRRRASPR